MFHLGVLNLMGFFSPFFWRCIWGIGLIDFVPHCVILSCYGEHKIVCV